MFRSVMASRYSNQKVTVRGHLAEYGQNPQRLKPAYLHAVCRSSLRRMTKCGQAVSAAFTRGDALGRDALGRISS